MRYLTFNELRDKLGGRGRTTIYRDIAAKRLPTPIKIGSLNYFCEDQVNAALKALVITQDGVPSKGGVNG
jgi:prophage regulatory protein